MCVLLVVKFPSNVLSLLLCSTSDYIYPPLSLSSSFPCLDRRDAASDAKVSERRESKSAREGRGSGETSGEATPSPPPHRSGRDKLPPLPDERYQRSSNFAAIDFEVRLTLAVILIVFCTRLLSHLNNSEKIIALPPLMSSRMPWGQIQLHAFILIVCQLSSSLHHSSCNTQLILR